MDFVQILSQAQDYAGAISGVFASLIVLFILIPGQEPENTLQKILNIVKKFSRK